MLICEYCAETIDTVTYRCSYCSSEFCRSHRIPENHNCENISDAHRPTSARHEADAEPSRSHDTSPAEDLTLDEIRERAEADAKGEAYTVADINNTVGNRPEPEYDTSPDVAIDGSVKRDESAQELSSETPSGIQMNRYSALAVILILTLLAAIYLVMM